MLEKCEGKNFSNGLFCSQGETRKQLEQKKKEKRAGGKLFVKETLILLKGEAIDRNNSLEINAKNFSGLYSNEEFKEHMEISVAYNKGIIDMCDTLLEDSSKWK